MTRVNLVCVEILSDRHLLSEHREIKRIPNCILKGKFNLKNIPDKFCLGTGHVRFFYNKGAFLLERYCKIHHECLKRELDVENYYDSFYKAGLKYPHLFLNWKPTGEDIKLSMRRINERIKMKPHLHRWTKYKL